MRRKKVFVSGCFDVLHSGHLRFLEKAASYGDVHVGIGSDTTVTKLKGRPPTCNQWERQYMVQAIRHVKSCYVNQGSGAIDFSEELKRMAPDYFIVNEDGDSPAKAQLCEELGVEYLVFKRDPYQGLHPRSTTALRKMCHIPYRLDLAGGWLDQPFISKNAPGPVLNICLEPTVEFAERCGMASSSRCRAMELWESNTPTGDRVRLAKMLFCYENPPGTKTFSGSQDAIGIVFPGLNRLDYHGDFWPEKITTIADDAILSWLERHLHLIPTKPRKPNFDVYAHSKITPPRAARLATAAAQCWDVIKKRNAVGFGHWMRQAFEAQVSMFPGMLTPEVDSTINRYSKIALGWKVSGAGGGGYIVLVSEEPVPGAVKINIRRAEL